MQSLSVEIAGVTYTGTYRVTSGSVIVYFDADIKFSPKGIDPPEVVARWLLRDLCLRSEAHKHKLGKP
ncbi:hypothetical protein LMG24235_08631 [Paraburkholderia sabiae]|nr:hypothetical protein LMG24235_08631 [Paraburkholderia sabiae]